MRSSSLVEVPVDDVALPRRLRDRRLVNVAIRGVHAECYPAEQTTICVSSQYGTVEHLEHRPSRLLPILDQWMKGSYESEDSFEMNGSSLFSFTAYGLFL